MYGGLSLSNVKVDQQDQNQPGSSIRKFPLFFFTKMALKVKKEASAPPKAEVKTKALKTKKAVLKGVHSQKKEKKKKEQKKNSNNNMNHHLSPTFLQPKILRY